MSRPRPRPLTSPTIQIIATVLLRPQVRQNSVNGHKDLIVRNDLTFEITPSTAEDAYGGWWVSVYGEVGLDKVRASDKELKAITVSKESVAEKKTVATNPVSSDDEQLGQWNGDDLRYSRSSKSKSTGGSVYVRGYTRKDGTYVQSHTRSSPR